MDFLQIPPHGGHPCPWLTVPTAKSVADFHRRVIAHAERTTKRADENNRQPSKIASEEGKNSLPIFFKKVFQKLLTNTSQCDII